MRRKGQQAENDKTERVTGLGRRTREEIAKWNQMTALRFQTGGRHQTSPASLQGIKVNGQKLETVTSLKYLDSVLTDESSKPEIHSRIAQTTAALTGLKPVWKDRMHSLVTSIFLYACESWTLTAELQRRI